MANKKVVVAMSGGVDSSVTAFLLKEQGYEVIGLYMRLFQSGSSGERAAREVAKKIGIVYYPVSMAYVFKQEVIDYYINNYASGYTPNPCVVCNKIIKFGELLRVSKRFDGLFATGHYVCREPAGGETGPFKLFRGRDKKKDQSYFLYNLCQEELEHVLFPIGTMEKNEIRAIADQANLPYLKKESQDVCFLHKDASPLAHNDFLKKHLNLKKGKIKTLDGQVLGEHEGLPLYTLGQRKGIEIGGIGPFYAARFDYSDNALYVVNDRYDPELMKKELACHGLNWISGYPPTTDVKCLAQIRYGHLAQEATVTVHSDYSATVKFKKEQWAVTPGQSIVFYQGEEMIGGGVIKPA